MVQRPAHRQRPQSGCWQPRSIHARRYHKRLLPAEFLRARHLAGNRQGVTRRRRRQQCLVPSPAVLDDGSVEFESAVTDESMPSFRTISMIEEEEGFRMKARTAESLTASIRHRMQNGISLCCHNRRLEFHDKCLRKIEQSLPRSWRLCCPASLDVQLASRSRSKERERLLLISSMQSG